MFSIHNGEKGTILHNYETLHKHACEWRYFSFCFFLLSEISLLYEPEKTIFHLLPCLHTFNTNKCLFKSAFWGFYLSVGWTLGQFSFAPPVFLLGPRGKEQHYRQCVFLEVEESEHAKGLVDNFKVSESTNLWHFHYHFLSFLLYPLGQRRPNPMWRDQKYILSWF